MTEDEFIFAVAALHGELGEAQKSLDKAEAAIASTNTMIVRHEIMYNATLEALQSQLKAPVSSLSEYKSLRSGIQHMRTRLEELRASKGKLVSTRNVALVAIPKIKAQIMDLEAQANAVEPNYKVLELRPK